MKDEYIIISKTTIQKRIEELEGKRKYYLNQKEDYSFHNHNSINGQIELLNSILSQSTPLIPEIEKAWKTSKEDIIMREYFENLKLDI